MASPPINRRRFLQASGAGAVGLGLGLAGIATACGESEATGSTASTAHGSGKKRPVNLGFIALTDAASAIMAHELGYFSDRDLEVTITKQASWPALRDALLNGQLDCAHCLYSMPFASATKVGGPGNTDLKLAMILNNNGQGITLSNEFKDLDYGDLEGAGELLNSKNAPELGMTFPGGTHDLWLRYWLKAAGADSSKLKISPIPPPQMVQNMTVGNVSGYCVGEPWNGVAVENDIGFTYLATQDLWLHHPEKALVANAAFAENTDDTLADVMGAILDASRWLDDPANRSKAADTIAPEQYVNAPADAIRSRLTGVYDLGAGHGTKDFEGEQMQFFRDGLTNFPRRSYGIWALTQYQRLGLIDSTPDYTSLVDDITLTDLYEKVAAANGIDVPDDDMAEIEIRLDNVTFDPNDPKAEVARP